MLAKGNISPLLVETFPRTVLANVKRGNKQLRNKQIVKLLTDWGYKMYHILK
jgi:hypothetical protein